MNLLFCLLLTLIPIESLPDEVADVLYTYVDDRDIMSVGTTGQVPAAPIPSPSTTALNGCLTSWRISVLLTCAAMMCLKRLSLRTS